MAFSSSTLLADLDYIAPSQACIKPQVARQAGTVGLHGEDRHGDEEPVKITLQDCLACSGCVTTAETLLVTSQSRPQIEKTLFGAEGAPDHLRPQLIVASISDQSAASIAAHMGISMYESFLLISGFMREVLHATHVTDMRWAQRLALHETSAEFLQRLQSGGPLPLIVSACPGWVCYCEKTQPFLIPYASQVMSPQAIVGKYVKQYLPRLFCESMGLSEHDARRLTYHISVQPCFDRKLEAARPDLTTDAERETDCVLGTQELLEWMTDMDPSYRWRAPLDSRMEPLRPAVSPCAAARLEGSGGYHQRAMAETAAAAGVVPDIVQCYAAISYTERRNSNHRLATLPGLSGPTGTPMIFGVVYGFQHIQNLVRTLKRGGTAAPSYSFIEVMACPEGCLNGGGQIRTADRMQHYERLAVVASVFEDFSSAASNENEYDEVPVFSSLRACRFWIGGEPGSEAASQLLRTVLHDRQAEMQLKDNIVVSLRW